MSDIQDLIHKTTMDSIERGKVIERERIIKFLESDYWHHLSYLPRLIEDKATLVHDKECLGCQLLTFIKGENNG